MKEDTEGIELSFVQRTESVARSDVVDVALKCVCQRWATLNPAEDGKDLTRFAEENVPTVACK